MKTNSYKKIITTAIGLLTLFGMVFGGWYQAFASENNTSISFTKMAVTVTGENSVVVSGNIKFINATKLLTDKVSSEDLMSARIDISDSTGTVYWKNFKTYTEDKNVYYNYNKEYPFSMTVEKSFVVDRTYYAGYQWNFKVTKLTNVSFKIAKTTVSIKKPTVEKIDKDSVRVRFNIKYINTSFPQLSGFTSIPEDSKKLSIKLTTVVDNRTQTVKKVPLTTSSLRYNEEKELQYVFDGLSETTSYTIQLLEDKYDTNSALTTFSIKGLQAIIDLNEELSPTTPPAPAPVPAPGSNGSSTPPASTPTPSGPSVAFDRTSITETNADGTINVVFSVFAPKTSGNNLDFSGTVTYEKRSASDPLPPTTAGNLSLQLTSAAPLVPVVKTIDVTTAPIVFGKAYPFTASFNAGSISTLKNLQVTETDLKTAPATFQFKVTNPDGTSTDQAGNTDSGDQNSETSSEPKKADRPLLSNPLRSDLTTIPGIVNAIVSGIVIPVAIPLLALAIMYTGFLFVIAKGNPEKLKTAKEALKWTVYGGLIILGSYIIAEALQGTLKDILGQ